MFDNRSTEKELLDMGPDFYTETEYIDCLKKLFYINKILGFFRDTKKIIKKFSKESTLLDVGCGGGLFILHLSKVFPHMKMSGVDISSGAINEAKKSLQSFQKDNPDILVDFQLQNQAHLNLAHNSVDIILLTLVCHHLSDNDLVNFLRESCLVANKVVIINDLHRNRFAHAFYGILSPLFFRNRLITHDGLISIRRGFTRTEWEVILKNAGIHHYTLKWCFPFRWQLIIGK